MPSKFERTANIIHYIRVKVMRMNQTEMAQAIGVARNTISRWELGKAEPLLHDIQAIKKACHWHPLWNDGLFFDGPPADFLPPQPVKRKPTGPTAAMQS